MSTTAAIILFALFFAVAVIAFFWWKIKSTPDNKEAILLSQLNDTIAKVRDLEQRLLAKEQEVTKIQSDLNARLVSATKAVTEKEAAENSSAKAEQYLLESERRAELLTERLGVANERAVLAEAGAANWQNRFSDVDLCLANLQQKYDQLALENQRLTARTATLDSEKNLWHEQVLNLTVEINGVRKDLAETIGKLNQASAKHRTDDDAAKLFEAVSQKVLKETMDEAKKGVHEIAQAFQKSSETELERHVHQISQTLEPLSSKLKEYDEAVDNLKKNSHELYGGLKQQIEGLQTTEQMLHTQAKALTAALSSSPKVRGNYGEMLLKQLIEFVGMREHCHFQEQVHTRTEDGLKIPDLIVYLPEGQKVIVDAKAVMNACVEAHAAQDETQRLAFLKQHSQNVRIRVDELASKNYATDHRDAVEVVVLFIPAENLYATSMEYDPDLTEYALKKNIIVCGPNSLIMLLKVAGQLWRRAIIEEEVEKVRKSGNEIYKYTSDFLGKYIRLGHRIKQLVQEYDEATGTLDNHWC